jgi:hypothetical protein
VLQGFNSQLTMLDRAVGSEASDNGDFGSAGPTASRERKPALAAARPGDLDDEIPF